MDGIHIPAETAAEAKVPEDLDSGQTGAYTFPTPERRRTASIAYLALAVALGFALPDSDLADLNWADLSLANARWAFMGLALLLGLWHWRAAWPLSVDASAALELAAAAAPFPIGQASAAIIFSGLRSRPLWHVVLYDAAEPPSARALVVIDGVDGSQVRPVYTEPLGVD